MNSALSDARRTAMRRSILISLVLGLLGLGARVSQAQTQPPVDSLAMVMPWCSVPIPPIPSDLKALLVEIGQKLNWVRAIAVERQDHALRSEVDGFQGKFQALVLKYDATIADDTRLRAQELMGALDDLIGRVQAASGVTSPLPPDSTIVITSPTPDSTLPSDVRGFLVEIGQKLDRVRVIAVERQDQALVSEIDQLQEVVQAAIGRCDAGFADEVRSRIPEIMGTLDKIIGRLNAGQGIPSPMPPLPPDSSKPYPDIPPGTTVIKPPLLTPDSSDVARGLQKARIMIDSLSAILARRPIPQASDLLARAAALADSVKARLNVGSVYVADDMLRQLQSVLGRTYEIVRLYEGTTKGLVRALAVMDSLERQLAEQPNAQASDLLARAAALADSAQARLDEGRIEVAAAMVRHLQELLGRVQGIVGLQTWVANGLVRAHAAIDSLQAQLAEYPDPQISDLLSYALTLLDSVQARLDEGQTEAAGAAMKHVYELLERVQGTIRFQADLTQGIATFRQELAKAETLITNASDSAAVALYARAVEAADSASAHLAGGRLQAAAAWLEQGHRALNHALFIVTAPERAAQEIAALRQRVADLLAKLPATAAYERGVVTRAGELADSAQAALDRGEVQRALQIVERVHGALSQLVQEPGTMPPWPTPLPSGEIPLDDVMTLARQWIGQAVALTDSTLCDSAKALVSQAIATVQQASVALASSQPELAKALAVQAVETGVQAVNLARGDALPGTSTDPIMEDLIQAGEAAARAAQDPLEAGETALLPTEYTVSNAPNPFNPSTKIRFTLAAGGPVNLAIYNMLGQEVCSLVNDTRPAGVYEVVWNGRDHAGNQMGSGVYFARLETGNASVVTRMVLSR